MTDDSASHRVFKISELTRLIANHLIPISRESTVNLACACRYLEEPVLSTLWETNRLLETLLRVLPEENWEFVWCIDTVVRGLIIPCQKNRALKFMAILVLDHGRPIAGGLE